MFIPLSDDNRGRRIIPLVNYCLIGLNAYVWYLQLTLGENFTSSLHKQGGVAYMAHIGGFVVGFATGALLRVARPSQREYRFGA